MYEKIGMGKDFLPWNITEVELMLFSDESVEQERNKLLITYFDLLFLN